ncbi:MAG: DUF3656 domain-containing protein, partial [Clostridia bacterium]|nr:DUF3656 domain-containing protein [Clostridia bacterium]
QINGLRITGEAALEVAQTRPLSKEDIEKCFNKVDTFPFLPELDIHTDGVFIAQSALNAFRRQVYSTYYEKISACERSAKAQFTFPVVEKAYNGKTAVISSRLDSMKADIGILKPDDYTKDLSILIGNFKGEKYLFVPPYLKGEELNLIEKVVTYFDGIYCDNYFALELSEKLKKPLFAGCGFNITNSIALSKCNAKYICVSKELTFSEVSSLAAQNVFCLAGGNIKVMDLIYCPFEKKCKTCDMRREYTLCDEAGRKFTLHRYKTSECRFEVFNCADLVSDNCPAGILMDKTLSQPNKLYTRGHTVTGIF